MSKPIENLAVFDSNRDVFANWKEADPLHFAWFGYSSFEMRERYRESGSKSAALSKALELEMQLELSELALAGHVQAIGIPRGPSGDAEPILLPKSLFGANGVRIDWSNDRISGLGFEFEEVRICGTPSDPMKLSAVAISAKRGGGRPSQYPAAEEVFSFLFKNEELLQLPAAALREHFNLEFVRSFKRPPMSERSLRKHLKRYRKELEETRKSDFAN